MNRIVIARSTNKAWNSRSLDYSISFLLVIFCLLSVTAYHAHGANRQQWIDKFNSIDNGFNNGAGFTTSQYISSTDPNMQNGPELAWHESYLLNAYLNMYQATQDVNYLNDFKTHFDNIKSVLYTGGQWSKLTSYMYSYNLVRNSGAEIAEPNVATVVVNEGFETGNPLPTGWAYWNLANSSNSYRDSSISASGGYCLTINSAGNGWYAVEKQFAYVPGVLYGVLAMTRLGHDSNDLLGPRVQIYDYTSSRLLGEGYGVTKNYWSDVFFTFTAPASGDNVRIRLYQNSSTIAGSVHFDDVAVWPIDTYQLPRYWSRSVSGNATTAYRDTATGHFKNGLAGFTVINTSSVHQMLQTNLQNVIVNDNKNYEPNTRYRINFWVNHIAGGSGCKGRIDVCDVTTGQAIYGPTSISSTSWQSCTGYFTTPSVANHNLQIRLYHDNNANAATTCFDDIQVLQAADYVVHDGQIAVPLMRFLGMVRNGEIPNTSSYLQDANDMYNWVTTMIARWDPTLVSVDSSRKVYIQPDDGSDKMPNISLPHNQYLPLGEARAWGFRAGGPQAWENDALAIFSTFYGKLVLSNNACNWRYYDDILASDDFRDQYPEDYSHGNLDVRAVIAGYENGVKFSRTDINRFAATFHNIMWNQNTTSPDISLSVDGTGGYGGYIRDVGNWIQLGWYDPNIFNIIKTYFDGLYTNNNVDIDDLETVSELVQGQTNLKAMWNLNNHSINSSNMTTDNSCYLNDGTLINFSGTTWVTGKSDKGLQFNNGAYVDCGNDSSLQLKTTGTLAFWFKSNGWPSACSSFIGRGDCGGWPTDSTEAYNVFYHYNYSGGPQIICSIGDGAGNISFVKIGRPDNNWHHYVFTFDGTNMRSFLDGALQETSSQTVTIINQNASLKTYMGKYSSPVGVLDQVRIYDRALSTTEVTSLYNSGK